MHEICSIFMQFYAMKLRELAQIARNFRKKFRWRSSRVITSLQNVPMATEGNGWMIMKSCKPHIFWAEISNLCCESAAYLKKCGPHMNMQTSLIMRWIMRSRFSGGSEKWVEDWCAKVKVTSLFRGLSDEVSVLQQQQGWQCVCQMTKHNDRTQTNCPEVV